MQERPPRDAQRRRVYLAETPLGGRRLRDLPACEEHAALVVGSLWWTLRFPARDLGHLPRFRPGNGARQAFFRVDAEGPSITLPRRYRTHGVVLHELAHWALADEHELAAHGATFARLLLDATIAFEGEATAAALAAAYREHNVRLGAPPRPGPDGVLRYGWDERLSRARGQRVQISYGRPGEPDALASGALEGMAGRGRSRAVRIRTDAAEQLLVPLAAVWDVRRAA